MLSFNICPTVAYSYHMVIWPEMNLISPQIQNVKARSRQNTLKPQNACIKHVFCETHILISKEVYIILCYVHKTGSKYPNDNLSRAKNVLKSIKQQNSEQEVSLSACIVLTCLLRGLLGLTSLYQGDFLGQPLN